MIDTDTLRVLVVGAVEEDALAVALADRPDIESAATEPGAVPATLAATPVDCLVVTDVSLDVRGVEAVHEHRVPVVAYTDEATVVVEGREWVSGYVRRAGDAVDHLADEIRWVTKHETRLELHHRRRRIARLHAGTAALAGVRTVTDLYERTVEVAAKVFDFDACLISLREGDRLVRKTHVGPQFGADALDVSEGVAGETYRTGEAMLIADVAHSDAVVPPDTDIGSLISVPIGEAGVFQAVSVDPTAFDTVDLELAELLISHVTQTLERLWAESDLRRRRERVAHLHEGTAHLVATRLVEDLYERTVDVAERVLEFETCYLFVAESDRFAPVATSSGSTAVAVDAVSRDHGLVARTFRNGESVLVDDIRADPAADPAVGEYGSGISVPIEGVGVFQAVSRDDEPFTEADLELAELLISYVTATHHRIVAEENLRSERDRLDALFENVSDPAIAYEFVDGVPVARRVNSTFERVFGFDEASILGENVDEYVLPPDERTSAIRCNERLHGGQTVRMEVTRSTAHGLRDFLLHVVPFRLGAENPAGYAIYTDLSEQKARERELRRQNERLDEFASVVSHDLRNPLNVAQGRLEFTRDTGDLHHLEAAADALDRIDRLVTDLLTLAREGQVVGDAATVDLRSVAQDAWATVETAEATLSVHGEAVFEADGDRLRDLLENLFRNAVRHAGNHVTVEVGPLANGAGFYVADDGPGIDVDAQEMVFETGYTTCTEGTGFGLPIVRRIADAHGWAVRAVTSDAGGARFEFETE